MYFFVRTINPRPSFHLDMTDAERDVMRRHVAYWTEQARAGVAVVFGPVLDPAGAYGVGVYEAVDEDAMRRLVADDPAYDLLKCQVTPMGGAVVGEQVRSADRSGGSPTSSAR